MPSASTSSAAPTATPDGFVPTRLKPGEKPPQFVVVSFDGAGWDEMWQHWFAVAQQVPFRFTGFLSGTYLLSYDNRDDYHPPHYPPGTSAIGWNSPDDVPVEIRNLDRALRSGDEIGTHFNGHFCVSAGEPSGGDNWTTADWDTELDQFFDLLAHVQTNNDLKHPRLHVTAADIHGERTPCLEGHPDQLYPALVSHHLTYDASFTRDGLSWPTRAPNGLWQLGMQLFPMHGRLPDGRTEVPVTSMDYNYYYAQHHGSDVGVTLAQSQKDEAQVQATYEDMYAAAYAGNRAPLILGNHFNDWDHDAYVDALTNFVEQTCGRPDTECVTMSDLVAWLEAQSPKVLHRLQNQATITRPVGRPDDD
jgi:hypothetical protein